MLVTFLIMLREGLEVALIIGIIASYVVQRGQRHLLASIWAGLGLATLASLALGAGLIVTGAEFPQREQELFEAAVALIAVVLLVSMVFWMRKAGRSIRDELQARTEAAIAAAGEGNLAKWSLPLIGFGFLITGREGVESVMFLAAVAEQATGWDMPVGAALGLAVAALMGVLIFQFGVRLNLGRFFRVTGVIVLFVAAGLLAGALHELHEAGLWNLFLTPAYDLTTTLPEDGVLGSLLSALFGYSDNPTVGEFGLWLGFLIPSLILFLRPAHPGRNPTPGPLARHPAE